MEAKTCSMIKAPGDLGTRSRTVLSSIWPSSGTSAVLEAASTLIFCFSFVMLHKFTNWQTQLPVIIWRKTWAPASISHSTALKKKLKRLSRRVKYIRQHLHKICSLLFLRLRAQIRCTAFTDEFLPLYLWLLQIRVFRHILLSDHRGKPQYL